MDQTAVERRDEVEPVAVLLSGEGDTFAERAEERVAEDDAQRLRRQDADRHRLTLGEHPGDGVRRVAELARHVADPLRGLWGQPIGGVEGERDRRLADAGLAGNIGDARSLDPLLDQGLVSAPRPGIVLANRFSKPVYRM